MYREGIPPCFYTFQKKNPDCTRRKLMKFYCENRTSTEFVQANYKDKEKLHITRRSIIKVVWSKKYMHKRSKFRIHSTYLVYYFKRLKLMEVLLKQCIVYLQFTVVVYADDPNDKSN